MSIYQIKGNNLKSLYRIFQNSSDTTILSCLQGHLGNAYADSEVNPESAQVIVADFCFFAGNPNEELVRNRPEGHTSDFVIMVPENDEWSKVIEKVYGNCAKKIVRYAIKKEKNIFDLSKLHRIVENLSSNYEICLIDSQIYDEVMKREWSSSLCGIFENFEKFKKNGIGAVALFDGEVVSGASTYSFYDDGIEVQIDTREDHQRRGLALACGARLILECIKNDKYPSWDAKTKASVSLAEKLGYHFEKEYTAYEVGWNK